MLLFQRGMKLLKTAPTLANNLHTSYFCSQTGSKDSDSKAKKLLDMLSSKELKNLPEFDSDIKEDLAELKRQKQMETPVKAQSELGSIILFPGQGNHFVGMGKELLQYENVKPMYEVASDILGYDLLDLCLNGPHNKLGQTVYSQPATVVTSLAAIESLRATSPAAIERCVTTAGYSVGEISALVFADCLHFEDAVRLVKKRAELMQADCDGVKSGLMAIKLRADSKLNYALKLAREYCNERLHIQDPVCEIAIDQFTGAKVIGGHIEALDFVAENAQEFAIGKCQRIDVSGAFHTSLMKNASVEFAKYLQDVEIRRPLVSVYSNVTRFPYRSAAEVRKNLAAHLTERVQWAQTMQEIYRRPQNTEFPMTYEMGPGKRLLVYLKNVNSKACRQNYIFVRC